MQRFPNVNTDFSRDLQADAILIQERGNVCLPPKQSGDCKRLIWLFCLVILRSCEDKIYQLSSQSLYCIWPRSQSAPLKSSQRKEC